MTSPIEPVAPHRRLRVFGELTVIGLALVLGLAFFSLGADTTGLDASVDLVAGTLSCLALPLRHRYPVALAVALVPVNALSATGTVAYLVALFALAQVRPARLVLLVAALHVAAPSISVIRSPDEGTAAAVSVLAIVLVVATVVAWGLLIGERRAVLNDRARQLERTRIAREMHDVLAHRVSIIALHAGGLELATDREPAQVRETAALISETARLAMQDLRDVLGGLRAGEIGPATPSTGEPVSASAPAPLPSLADVPKLVEQSRAAGLPIELRMDVEAAPGAQGRDAFRVVQESLTNIHRHARAAPTSVLVQRGRAGEVIVEVRNHRPPGRRHRPVPPGAGMGMLGLVERVSLAGGTLEHGPGPGGRYVVRAALPAR